MNVFLFDTRDEVALAVAHRVADELRAKPELVLGLPAGQTPVPAYAVLRRLSASGQVDFSRASCFTLDEFVGVGRTHPASFHRFIADHLLSGVNIDPARVQSLDGASADLEGECQRYERAIDDFGGLDLLLLGLGRNGHVGFNEPGESLVAPTHRVALLPETRHDNASRFGGDLDRVPTEGLSMGVGTILKAKAIVMIATGDAKAKALREMIRGPVTTRMPASFLQLHGNVEVYVDRDAGTLL